jgi:micrococcal nuclease
MKQKLENGLYVYKAKPIKVVDGDTIYAYIDLGFDTWTYRNVTLASIDAPEIRTLNEDEKLKGLISKEALEMFLSNSLHIFIISKGYDAFGRCIADIYTEDGQCVNTYMISTDNAKFK